MLFFLEEREGWNNSIHLKAKNIDEINLNSNSTIEEGEGSKSLNRFYKTSKYNANKAVNKMKWNVAKVKASYTTSLLHTFRLLYLQHFFEAGFCAEGKKRQPYRHKAQL